MSGADLYGPCPGCGVNVDPWSHDCPSSGAVEPRTGASGHSDTPEALRGAEGAGEE